MAETSAAPGTAPVADHRPVPRGVLPRGTQTWLMVGLAVCILLIILIAGRPEPAARPVGASTLVQAPTAERVRDYQDRLRMLEARTAQEAQSAASAPSTASAAYEESRAPAPEDSIKAERRRREYESLFASNVVISRRPESDRPDSGRPTATAVNAPTQRDENPSIDDIADAVVRATTRVTGNGQSGRASAIPMNQASATTPAAVQTAPPSSKTPAQTEPISAAGPLHRILEGTIVDTVLTNRLDGNAAAPVNCLVTNALYSHSGQQVVIPAGARILGETKAVQAFGESRLAVAFHRVLMPDGRTYSLDQFIGLNQIGDAGLRDQVNQHYWATFGAAGAVGLISGLAQYLGSAGLARGDGDRTVIIAGGATDATAQASVQVMNRFLNRLPTITIREGHRVKVYLTSDLELPAYETPTPTGKF
jgi:type IV secretory pathway VirB10-like protein